MIGTILDDSYRVESRIGEGTFGVVYLCTEIALNRPVAIKMITPSVVGTREGQRLLTEGRHLAALNHPNVVQIYRLGRFADAPYIVMEHLTGKTLRSVLSASRPPLPRGLEMMHQVASGLAAIHGKNLVHRDLSTNNIMVLDTGILKILDLGLARDITSLSTATAETFLAGTIPFISPEQVDGKPSQFASDIFAFGVMMYEVLTGSNPFEAEHYMSVLYNIVHRAPSPLESYVTDPPEGLAILLVQCLEKRPEDRPHSMQEVQDQLHHILSTADLDRSQPRGMAQPSEARLSAQRNPYLNRVMIKRKEDFFGREQELRRIYSRLNANPPGSVSIVGERKIGKSSLLNHVYMRSQREIFLEHPESMIMVFLDLQEQHGISLDGFVKVLLHMASFELRGRLDVGDCSSGLNGIKDLVQRLEKNGFRLAIMLDEFEVITRNPKFDLEFFSFLRFLANHYNVAYVTSSARDLQVLCHTKEISDSPFFNIFTTMRLSVFKEPEALELIRVPSERVGRPLEPYAKEILALSGLFPFLIQIACSHMMEHLEEVGTVREPDLREMSRTFYEEAKLHYRYMWDGFDGDHRNAITRVARRKGIPEALRHVLEDLKRRHYVAEGSNGDRLFSGPFAEFVLKEAREPGPRSLWERIRGRGHQGGLA